MSLVFAMIVCRDAMGIRRLAGRHSRLLRELMEREKSREKTDILPQVPAGHTPQEVAVGAFIGATVAFLLSGHARPMGHLVRYLENVVASCFS